MAYQVGDQCYRDAEAAAYAVMARLSTDFSVWTGPNPVTGNTSEHICQWTLGTFDEVSMTVQRYCDSGDGWGFYPSSSSSMYFMPCGLVELPDAQTMAWFVVAAWVAAYAVKELARIVRDR